MSGGVIEQRASLEGLGTSADCVSVILSLMKTSPEKYDRDLGHLRASLENGGDARLSVDEALEINRCEAVIRDLLEEIWIEFGADFLWFTTQEGASSVEKAAVVAEQLSCGFGPARRAGVRLGALIDSRDQMMGIERAQRPWAAD